MKKSIALFAAVTLLTLNAPVASAYTSSYRSYSSPYRSYSQPRTYSAPKTSTTPKTSTPKASAPTKTTQSGKWSSNKSYGKTNGTKTGKGKLISSTPKPEPHSFNNRKFYSSDAIYTNTSGQWVTYFILGALVGNAVSDANNKEVHCFDKDHKEITCNRDDNSYSKDW